MKKSRSATRWSTLIFRAARKKFGRHPKTKLYVQFLGEPKDKQNILDQFQVFVGEQKEHSYAVVELEDGSLDFEERD